MCIKKRVIPRPGFEKRAMGAEARPKEKNSEGMELDTRKQPPEWRKIRDACMSLLGKDPAVDPEVIRDLTPEYLNAVFRKKAKLVHPDLVSGAAASRVKEMTETFIELKKAHELLNAHVQAGRQWEGGPRTFKKTIIAVGGAKGGIGKSLFAANLGIVLAASGFKTVVVDLDLGSANLHLYLGEKSLLEKGINDYLNKSVSSLEDVMVQSPHGPFIIGGDSSVLGAANLAFAKKLKLIRAIRELRADVVILDLGGDTNYNILDFFLSAHVGIVMTTRDSAATLSAYHFLKGALYRRLDRLFSPESPFRKKRDERLEGLIKEHMKAGVAEKRTVNDLMNAVKRRHPRGVSLLREVLSRYSPCLLVNKTPRQWDPKEVFLKLRGVTAKWLSIRLNYLGAISHQPLLEQSAISLVPVAARYPRGHLVRELNAVIRGSSELRNMANAHFR